MKRNTTAYTLQDSRSDYPRFFARLLAVCLAFYLVFGYIFALGIVNGNSMQPTYHDNSLLFIRRAAPVERGNIVMIDSQKIGAIIKRVIAVPGDTISIDSGQTYLNGDALEEPYVVYKKENDFMDELTVPDGYYFVMGDNRPTSIDSRSWISLIPEDEVIGVVLLP